jgi:predicted homoserine dehydrogenase-like protein
MEQKSKVGIVGTGYIARGLVMALEQQDFVISKVLTRTAIGERTDFPGQKLLTTSVNELIDNSDIVVECTGDVIYATEVIDRVLSASRPVVTMDAEFHVTTGSYFIGRGLITEAEGDQPGCLAAFAEDIIQMGFRPLVFGNVKGFLNYNPTREEMEFWAAKQGINLDKCIAFTDGTKVQIEQVLVANGLGAGIAKPGLAGIATDDIHEGAVKLYEYANKRGYPISDYILSSKLPPGVFIVAQHDERQKLYLRNFKLGEGPYYVLLRNFHLCHLEVAKTLKRVLTTGEVLLDNSKSPSISVASIAKRPLKQGEIIEHGIGSFDVRGSAVEIRDNKDHVPVGLLVNAVVKHDIALGQQINFDDVEVPDSMALHIWQNIVNSL